MGKHTEKKLNKKKIFLNILIIIFMISLIFSSVYIGKWLLDNKANKKIADKVSKTIIDTSNNEETEYKVDFEKLKEINNEIVAYLKVKGTKIEYAVVQAKDNNYYLRRNLDKKYSVAGSIFMDYKNKLNGTDKNIIIYGHNMEDDSMFGSLKNILNEEWYENEENYIIDFITENGTQKYQVFSIYQIKTEDYYINTEFKDGEFEKFITTLKNRSKFNFGVDVSNEDSILTLSTCANNYRDRIVLHAKNVNN